MAELTIRIDGREVKAAEGTNILRSAQDADIYIPALCYHPDLKTDGRCRLCVVDVEGISEPVLACMTAVAPGMVVSTHTAALQDLRREALKQILIGHPHACLDCWRRERCQPFYICLRSADVTQRCIVCDKNGHCELQKVADYVGVLPDIPYKPKDQPVETDHPFFVRDPNLCILCGRCVRMCRDVRGVGVWAFDKEDAPTKVVTVKGGSALESGCKSCMACVEVCPTGALMDREAREKLFVDREAFIVPCTPACPARIDIPRYVYLVSQGKFAEALAVIREKVPFPGSLGRVCIHPCEENCRRGVLNECVSIKELKRVAADLGGEEWKARAKKSEPTGKKVAVVGAGPAGLTGAFYLAKNGHAVTIFESLPDAGGMMRYGIPEYRLPRDVLAGEVQVIKDAGVDIKTGVRVESVDGLFEQGYNAVLLAVGAHRGQKMRVPGEDLPGVMDGATFLREVNLGHKVDVGSRVAVVGGGNSAIDGARVALRVGAKQVNIIYRRTGAEMPAAPEEVQDALDEGIEIVFLVAPSKVMRKDSGLELECIRMRLGKPDASGRRQPEPVPGSEFVERYDTIIASIGQQPEVPAGFGIKPGRGNTIPADSETLETARKGVFAAGDVVTGPASVVGAIAAGRKAAIAIDKYLGGSGDIEEVLAPVSDVSPWLGNEEDFTGRPRIEGPLLPANVRVGGFLECKAPIPAEDAKKEASRCLRCQLRLQICPAKLPPPVKKRDLVVA